MKRKTKVKTWGGLALFLAVIGFFGIPEILFKNFFIYPALGGDPVVYLAWFRIELDNVIMNMINMIYGALVWTSGKKAFF